MNWHHLPIRILPILLTDYRWMKWVGVPGAHPLPTRVCVRYNPTNNGPASRQHPVVTTRSCNRRISAPVPKHVMPFPRPLRFPPGSHPGPHRTSLTSFRVHNWSSTQSILIRFLRVLTLVQTLPLESAWSYSKTQPSTTSHEPRPPTARGFYPPWPPARRAPRASACTTV